MKESIQDDFRQWYMEYKRINGVFPSFPDESVWRKADFKFTLEEAKVVGSVVKGRELALTTELEKGDVKKDPKKGEKPVAVVDPLAKFKAFGQSSYLVQGQKLVDIYTNDWKTRDESDNFSQRHDQDIVKADMRKEVEAEIKENVFEILFDELRNLKLAVEKSKKSSKKGKGKKGEKGKGKAKKSKKGKGKKVFG